VPDTDAPAQPNRLDDTVADSPAPADAASNGQAVDDPAPGYTPPAHRKAHGLRGKLAHLFNWSRQPVNPDDPNTRAAIEVAVARRDANLLQLKQGYTDAIDTMAAVRRHMDEQAHRADRVIELLEGLPDILRAMPESAEKQARILEHIQSSLEAQHDTTKSLSTALQSATDSQKQVSTHLKAQLDASNESRVAMRDTLGTLTRTMSDVTTSNAATRDAFVQQASEARELFRSTTRNMWIMIGAMIIVAIVALGAVAYVAYLFNSAATAGTAASPAIEAPADPATNNASPANTPAQPEPGSASNADQPNAPASSDAPEADPLTASDLPAPGF